MLYFLNLSYIPNTAISNRLLGYYNAIDKMGVDATIVYLLPDTAGSRIEQEFKHIKVECYWNHVYSDSSVFRWIRFRWNLWRFLQRLKEGDVVYTYGTAQTTEAVLKISGVKCYCERTEHPAVIGGSGRTTGLGNIEQMDVMRQCNGLFVISRPLKEFFVSQGFDANKIHIVNMTVDPTRFEGIEKQPVKDRYIAYCGTASNNKDGVDELIKAFAIVAQQIPDIKLYIIGKAPSKDDAAGNLKLIEQSGLKDRIVFTGIVPAEQMPQLLKNAEVLALDRPDSLQAQCGFPTKLGEYLLTGNPVVVTKVGDIPLFLKDGESALLAEQRNAEDFSDKLIWTLTHPNEAEIIGKAGKDVAMKSFNCELETIKLIKVMLPDLKLQ